MSSTVVVERASHALALAKAEAIHVTACGGMDCFVANAPRNDVVEGAGGASVALMP